MVWLEIVKGFSSDTVSIKFALTAKEEKSYKIDETIVNYASSRECEAKTKCLNHKRIFSSNRRNLMVA